MAKENQRGITNPSASGSNHTSSDEAQQWLTAIVESSDDAIFSESLDGVVTSWNKGAQQIFGFTAAEIIGKPIDILGWPGNEDDMSRLIAKVCRKEPVDHYETTRKHKDGRRVVLSLSLSPILDDKGKIVGISKIARDMQLTDLANCAKQCDC